MVFRITRLILIVLLVSIWNSPLVTHAQALAGSVTAANLNLRSTPAVHEDNVLGQLLGGTAVTIEGRTEDGTWLFIRNEAGDSQGWAVTRYISFDESQLHLVPVRSETEVVNPPVSVEVPPVVTLPEGAITATTTTRVNVRNQPLVTAGNVLTQLNPQAQVVVDGRSDGGDWVLIHNADSTVRGWVVSRYIRLSDGGRVNGLPVVNDAGNLTQGSGLTVAPNNTPIVASAELVLGTPVFSNMTTDKVYQIFQNGQRLGNRANVFMKVGDSVSATQPFMSGFGMGDYNLGPYSSLQSTIDFFSFSPRGGVPNSFVYNGVASVNGFVSGAVLDGTWSPEFCGRLVPLSCEYDILKPSVAIILFGGQDARLFDAGFFRNNLRQITQTMINLGVIPVLNTFPMHESFDQEKTILFNTVVIDVANEFNVPVINLYGALQALPDGGAKPEDPVHLTQGDTYFTFNGEEKLYGVTLRNLLTLQALDILRQSVLQ